MRIQKTLKALLAATLGLMVSISLVGCGGKTYKTDHKTPAKKSEHGHAHPEEGKHGGYLVELGNDEYFAEVVEKHADESITVYIMTHDLKEVQIAADKIVANMMVDNKPTQFELAATNLKDGNASIFAGTQELHEAVEHGETNEVKLSIMINSKPYTGTFTHEQLEAHEKEHAGHEHGKKDKDDDHDKDHDKKDGHKDDDKDDDHKDGKKDDDKDGHKHDEHKTEKTKKTGE